MTVFHLVASVNQGIDSEQENEVALLVIENLLRTENRSPVEDAFLELLICLVEVFEAKAYPMGEEKMG